MIAALAGLGDIDVTVARHRHVPGLSRPEAIVYVDAVVGGPAGAAETSTSPAASSPSLDALLTAPPPSEMDSNASRL